MPVPVHDIFIGGELYDLVTWHRTKRAAANIAARFRRTSRRSFRVRKIPKGLQRRGLRWGVYERQ